MACAAMSPSRPVTSVDFGRASLTRQPIKRKETAQISFCVSLETSPFTLSLSSFANAAGAKSISPVSALHLSFSLLALASRNLRKGRRQLEGSEQLLDSRWVVLQPAVVGDGASVVELALRQFFRGSRAARVFENGLNRKVVNGRREDDYLLGRHVNRQVRGRLGLEGLARAKGHHVGKQGIAGKAGGA